MIDITPIASGSSGNSYYITDGSTPLLLDCGVPWKQLRQAVGFKTSGIAACCLSHEHSDHSSSIRDAMKAGIDIYASRGTIEALGVTGHRIKIVADKQQFTIGSWTGMAFQTEHDAAESLGFLLVSGNEKLLYATDTYFIRYRFQGLSHILIECNYAADILQTNIDNGAIPWALRNRLLKSHFSLENVKRFLEANDLSKVQEIWLCHLSDGNSDEARFINEIRALTGKPTYVCAKRC